MMVEESIIDLGQIEVDEVKRNIRRLVNEAREERLLAESEKMVADTGTEIKDVFVTKDSLKNPIKVYPVATKLKEGEQPYRYNVRF